jgi:hypothetical protein
MATDPDAYFGQGTGGTGSVGVGSIGGGGSASFGLTGPTALSSTATATTVAPSTASAAPAAVAATGSPSPAGSNDPTFTPNADGSADVTLPEISVTVPSPQDGAGSGSATTPDSGGGDTGTGSNAFAGSNGAASGSDPGTGTGTAGGSAAGSPGQVQFSNNILDNYFQVAYHIRFYTNGDGQSSNNKTIIIAESGVTGFNIKELIIDSLAMSPHGETDNVVATDFHMTITEPMGTSFLDAMFLATQQAGVANWQQAYYCVDISFMGYSETGTPTTNICSGLPNGGVWTYKMAIIDIGTHLSPQGCVYTLTGKMWDDKALTSEHLNIQEAYSIEASTVGDYFNKLAQKLNATMKLKYKTDLITYAFQFHDASGSGDPSQYKIHYPNEVDYNTFKNFSLANGTDKSRKAIPNGNAPRGMKISDLILSVIGTTDQGQNLIRDSNKTITGNDPQTHLGTGKFRDTGMFRVWPQLQVTGYDPVSAAYKTQVIFHVKMFKYQNTFLPKEVQNAATNSPQALQELTKYNGLCKRYDYYFTGLNTQVLDFDVKFNFAWQAVLPRFEGIAYYGENLEVHARYNDVARNAWNTLKQAAQQQATGNAQQASAAAAATAAALTGIATGAANPFANVGALGGNATAGATSATGAIANAATTYTTGTQQIQQAVGTQTQTQQQAEAAFAAAQAQIPSLTGSATTAYAEDVLAAAAASGASYNPMPISIKAAAESPRREAGIGLPSPYHASKSIYGALLEQTNSPFQNSLAAINITVKGDPYWLGVPYESQFTSTAKPTVQLCDYSFGDVCFFLNIRYPYQLGDSPQPTFRSQDVWSGIYKAVKIQHSFTDGMFKQTIQAQRQVKILPKEVQSLVNIQPT